MSVANVTSASLKSDIIVDDRADDGVGEPMPDMPFMESSLPPQAARVRVPAAMSAATAKCFLRKINSLMGRTVVATQRR